MLLLPIQRGIRQPIFRIGIQSKKYIHTELYPPIKTYGSNTNAIKLYWNYKVPTTFKYFSSLIAISYFLTHFHPSTLVTAGPPLLLGSWYGNQRWKKYQFNKLFDKIKPQNLEDWESKGNKIRIEKYDMSDIGNVVSGIENEFDNLKVQVLQVVEKKIIDYIIENKKEGKIDTNELLKLFIDENDQLSININHDNIETFVNTNVEIPNLSEKNKMKLSSEDEEEEITKFIKFSVPFFTNKDMSNNKRLGVIEIYLLKTPILNDEKVNFEQYKMRIEIIPYKFSMKQNEIIMIDKLSNDSTYESDKLINNLKKKNNDEYEEITVNL